MSKRVLLTGASGFVGASLARRLLRDGHELHLLLRPGFARWRIEEIVSSATCTELDMADAASLDAFISRLEPAWIFHLATHGAYPSQSDTRRMVETNIIGTFNLLEACARVGFEAFVNAGSSSEYGRKDHPPSESEGIEPNSAYAVTKASATYFCRHLARRSRLYIPTLRLYSVYGAFEEPTRLLPRLIVRGLEGELPLLATPQTARDFVHVDDVVEAFVGAAENRADEPGAIFNVGTGKQTTLRDVVALARDVLDIGAEPEWGSLSSREWDTEVWRADRAKIARELGWTPKIALEDGFRKTVEWLTSDPERLSYYRRIGAGLTDGG